MKSIYDYSMEVVDELSPGPFKDAADNAFAECQAELDLIGACFLRLREKEWDHETLKKFFRSYRETHLTMTSVAAMICRVIDKSEECDDINLRDTLRASVSGSCKVMSDDLGLSHASHSELYFRMATAFCGSEDWELAKYAERPAREFRKWVYYQRTRGPEIADGLMTSLASEVYNHGELTFLNQFITEAISLQTGLDAKQAKPIGAYVGVHAQGIEVEHFMAAYQALSKYSEATNFELGQDFLENGFKTYIRQVSACFDGIGMIFLER